VPGCEILELLGRGGMGIVYKARQTALDRMVAIKLMRAGAGADSEERSRFRTEVRAAAMLRHANIVQIYEVGELGGQPFCILEYVPDGNLQSRLSQGPMPPRDAAAMMLTMARAMDFAHRQGIIHRDLKPANVLLQNVDCRLQNENTDLSRGQDHSAFFNLQSAIPKIADFGLAKQLKRDASLTESGVILGTAQYMAPEQAEGTNVGPAADIYALGAILYEMLTGRPPFHGASPLETLMMLQNQDAVTVSRLQPNTPRDLETICMRCIEKDPARRYASAGELAEDLNRFLAGDSIQARPVGGIERAARWCRRKPAQAGMVLLAGLLVVGAMAAALVYQHHRGTQQADEITRQADARRKRELAEQQITDALEQAQQIHDGLRAELANPGGVFHLLNDPARWHAQVDGANAALERARVVQAGAEGAIDEALVKKLDALSDLVQQDAADRSLAVLLEKIRLDRSTWFEGFFDVHSSARDYPRAFADARLSLASVGDKPGLPDAALIQQSAIKEQLLAAIDDWAYVAVVVGQKGLPEQLLSIARAVDPDPWRDMVRDPAMWKDHHRLVELADQAILDDAAFERMSPQMLHLVGILLTRTAQTGAAAEKKDAAARHRERKGVAWLRQAQMRRPADFWINFELGKVLKSDNPADAAGYYRTALAVRMHSGAVWSNLGIAHRMQKDLPAAAKAFLNAVKYEPNNGPAWSNLSIAYLEQKNPAAALAAAEKSVALGPKSSSSWNNYGLALRATDAIPESVTAFTNATKFDKSNARAWCNLGYSLRIQKELPAAIKAFEQAIQLDDDYANAWSGLGQTLRDDKKLPAAIKAYRKALDIEEANAVTWYNLGNAQRANDELPAAIKSYDKALEYEPMYVEAWTNLGGVRYARHELTAAENALRKALEYDEKHAPAWNNLGMVLRDRKRFADAIDAYKQAIKHRPNHANTWYNYSLALVDHKDEPGAIAALEQAIKIEKTHANAWIKLGGIRRTRKEYAGAIEAYENVTAFDKNNAAAWTALGNCRLEMDDPIGAAKAYDQAMRCAPKESSVWHNIGVAHRRTKNLPLAEASFKKAIAINKKASESHFGLSLVYRDQGRFDAAVKAMEDGIRHLSLLERLHPTAQLIEFMSLASLEKRLAKVLAGDKSTIAERIALAEICWQYKRQYADAVGLYAGVFAEQPMLANDHVKAHRYNAACAAVLAAAGKNANGPTLDAMEKERLRRKALEWFRGDLDSCEKRLQSADADVDRIRDTFALWQKNADLAGVRDARVMDSLSESERADWRRFWSDVERVQKSASSKAVAP